MTVLLSLIAAHLVWLTVGLYLRQRVQMLSFLAREQPGGRALIHTASFLWAWPHALVVMGCSFMGIVREARRKTSTKYP